MSESRQQGTAGLATEREYLRRHPLFEGLSEGDLDQLFDMAGVRDLEAGATLMREGEPGDTMYLILSGEVEVSKLQGDQDQVIATRGVGEVVGEMALLEHAPRSATVRAIAPSRLLVIDQGAFNTLLSCSTSAAPTILHTVVTRLRNLESLLMQQEKLAGLGTMAAGLAHELNNPAAAIRRSSAQLAGAITALEDTASSLAHLPFTPEQAAAIAALRARSTQLAEPGARLDPRNATALEDEFEPWLEAHGVEAAYEAAPTLVASGWTLADLEAHLAPLSPEHVPVVLSYVTASATARVLLSETHMGAEAISAIVGSVKRYTYLDQAPVQTVDVHEGLEATLTMLRHKLRDGIEVIRDYGTDLPLVEAHGSELNQVWTNLIDNAVDALGGEGRITIRTSCTGREVAVEIHDDGPGIPDDVLPRLFDPFFTTKAVGSGTGLGLHIAYTIVVRRHRGQIGVQSKPGDTCFRVTLPVAPAHD
jgi:signal transduction histidine kinase